MFPSNHSFQVYMLSNRPDAQLGSVTCPTEAPLLCTGLSVYIVCWRGSFNLVLYLTGGPEGWQAVCDLWCNQQRSNFYLASSPGFPEKAGKPGDEANSYPDLASYPGFPQTANSGKPGNEANPN